MQRAGAVIAHTAVGKATWKKLHANVPRLLPATVLAGLVFVLDLSGRFGNAVGVLYAAPVLLVGLGAARQKAPMIVLASGCCALTVVGFAFSSDTSVVGVGVVNRVLSLLVIWLATSLCLLYLRAEDYLESARDCLPICASCKKIRDEEGRWDHLESYFSEQFAVKFTHGICPDCVRQLYPELVKKHLRYSRMRHQAAPKPAPGSLA